MKFRQKKFIISLLILALAILPMRSVLATGAVGFSSNEADVEVPDVKVDTDTAKNDVAKCHQHNASDIADPDHCQSSGHDMQGSGLDDACANAGCDQCSICTLAVFSGFSFQFTAGYVEHAFSIHEGILSYQIIPLFRPPRA